MKNTIKFFGLLALVAVIGFSMTTCDNGTTSSSKTLSSITLGGSYKTEYERDEGLNLAGLVVTAHYIDGSSKRVTKYTTDPEAGDPLIFTPTTVTVSYTESDVTKTSSFDVIVNGGTIILEITEFKITSPVSLSGVIDANTITVNVPYNTALTDMTVQIAHTGESVTLDGTTQNGSPVNISNIDFSSERTFTITASDASTRDYTVTVEAAQPQARIETTYYATLQDAFAAAANLDTVTVLDDIENQNSLDNLPLGTITLASDGNTTITLGANGSLFTINNGTKLILGDSTPGTSLTLRGKDGNVSSLVYVSSGGELELNENAIITGNTNSVGGDDAGGVFVSSGGSFTMLGGKITGNDGSGGIGGVYVDYGTFLMSGGEISGNGGTVGGVYVNYSEFLMSGGKITGNDGRLVGIGGVCVYYGEFLMSGGEISDNTASGILSTGGVDVSRGSFTMSGDSIVSGNTCTTAGGGVYVGGGSFTMKDNSTVRGNRASNAGGGVRVTSNGTFTMEGGVIYGNTEGSNSNTVTSGTGAAIDVFGTAVYAGAYGNGLYDVNDKIVTTDNTVPPSLP